MKYMHYNETKSRGTVAFPIELYHVTENHPQYVMPYHWHMETEIVRILDGSFQMVLDESEITMGKGDITLIDSGVLHAGKPENCVYDCVVFDMNMLASRDSICHQYLEKAAGGIAGNQLFSVNDGAVYRELWNVFERMTQREYGYELSVFGSLMHILYHFFAVKKSVVTEGTKHSHTKKRIQQLKKVLTLIETSYQSELTLRELSDAAGMSPKYFCRFFRELTHSTPIAFLNQYRIERACFLLISTDLSVTEIAYGCGFNDLSYFIRTFKKYKGTTPKKFTVSHF